MQRFVKGGSEYLVCFHTQESRPKRLSEPIICDSEEAWLGIGYYFWIDHEFAHYWGMDMKRATGRYDIYKALVNEDMLLNTTFDEKSYYFFVNSIEKVRTFLVKTGESITIDAVHRFLAEKYFIPQKITGIIYDDLPKNNRKGRIYSDIDPLYYKKRIQLVVFNINNVINFEDYRLSENCN